jgi:hypothetical protein
MKLTLFFSHAWNDKAGSKVKKLLLLLQKNYDVWLDKKEIELGNHINHTVAEGIQSCDIFISVWSRHANASAGVLFELNCAYQLKKPFLIFKIDDCSIDNSPFLTGREYVDFSGDDSSFDTQWVYANNHLMKASIAKLQQALASSSEKDAALQLTQEANQLQQVLVAVEDHQKRQAMGASGNDHSDIYIQDTLQQFSQTLKDEDSILKEFAARMSAISAKYPLQQDNDKKLQLTFDYIVELDPHESIEKLRNLKTSLKKQLSVANHKMEIVASERQQIDEFKKVVMQLKTAAIEESSKSTFYKLPYVKLFAPVKDAAFEMTLTYITKCPSILELMHAKAHERKNKELKALLALIIGFIKTEDLKMALQKNQIKLLLPQAYLINNATRLLVQAHVFTAEEVSFSLVSSVGIDKLTHLLFSKEWKTNIDKFLSMIQSNYGIKDNNLQWIKVAAGIISLGVMADGLDLLDGSDASIDTGTSSAAASPYWEDRMAGMGVSVNTNPIY